MKMIHMTCPGHPDATLEGYLLDCEVAYGQYTDRPAVIVCPGGGYVYCSPREGEPIALRYAAKGFHAFVLRYSTGFDAKDFAPWKEVDWAVGLLREKAEEWHIDPGKIATCGFSAGGHLAATASKFGASKIALISFKGNSNSLNNKICCKRSSAVSSYILYPDSVYSVGDKSPMES